MDKFVKLIAKLCLILSCFYSVSVLGSGAHKSHTETEARQCKEDNNCERMKSNFRKHAENWCSDDGGLSHIDPAILECKQKDKFCEVTARIYCKGTTAARGARGEGWYGCKNCKTPKDRENELTNLTGGFSRAVPSLSGNANWHTLCNRFNLKCMKVIDWEGTLQACESSAFDGSRAAFCGN